MDWSALTDDALLGSNPYVQYFSAAIEKRVRIIHVNGHRVAVTEATLKTIDGGPVFMEDFVYLFLPRGVR